MASKTTNRTSTSDTMKTTSKGKTARSRHEGKWRPAPARTPNTLMTLPPELRNKIWSYALIEEREDWTAGRRCCVLKMNAPKFRKWREPALLQTRKSVRTEASPVHYGGNDFYVNMSRAQMDGLCIWIEALAARFEPLGIKQVFGSIHVCVWDAHFCPHETAWALAKTIHTTELELVPGLPAKHHEREGRKFLMSAARGQGKTEDRMNTAIKLALKGKRESWTFGQLEKKPEDSAIAFLRYWRWERDSDTWRRITEV